MILEIIFFVLVQVLIATLTVMYATRNVVIVFTDDDLKSWAEERGWRKIE
jgi:hypothetical protein